MKVFKKDLEALVNSYSLENNSDTPDFILAEYMLSCLKAFESATIDREIWYGRVQKQSNTIEVNAEESLVSNN